MVPSGARYLDPGLIGHQRRRYVGRVHDEASSPSQDAVVLIFSGHGKTLASPFPGAVKISPVVPAPRLLAEVSPDRPLIAQLRAGNLPGGLDKGGIAFLEEGMVRHIADGGERPDPEGAVTHLPDTLELVEPADADHLFRGKDAVVETAEQVGPPGMDPGIARRKMAEGFLERLGTHVGKRWHGHDHPSFGRGAV